MLYSAIVGCNIIFGSRPIAQHCTNTACWLLINKLWIYISMDFTFDGFWWIWRIPTSQKSAADTNSNGFRILQTKTIDCKTNAAKILSIPDQSGSSLSFSAGWTGDPTELVALCEMWLSGDDVVTVSWLDWLSVDARDFDTEGDAFSL